ncbi:winged helix-turn-helix domain-containing protein [Alkaliphilus hydrothermalis]|uniref:DNA-binding transcriptional ArsR family regulator n=1 Tax=Alkaliphilus hydrothermalis TaxID=1482730 RepID=A0ABS2NNC1_9FIRM|nr:helix-turn-helix domain-containing protein [Alkaliphilus hydrothermalis]MBM7614433.1 DNA-binding transcriptional ArsR family regulator [Alkaliphilus hydrothermalis]
MKDILVMRDLEQIKAISHPYRVEVFGAFEGDQPQSAKQIAEKLGEPHAKVNYHIKSLLKVGILELVDEKVKSGIIEKYYLPAATKLVIDKSFMQNVDDDVLQSINQASISIFEKISADFYKSAEKSNNGLPKFLDYHNDYYLTTEESKELIGKINDLVKDYLTDKKDKTREDTRTFSIAVIGITKMSKNKQQRG